MPTVALITESYFIWIVFCDYSIFLFFFKGLHFALPSETPSSLYRGALEGWKVDFGQETTHTYTPEVSRGPYPLFRQLPCCSTPVFSNRMSNSWL